MKIRFLEPAEIPYKKTIQNYFVYDKYIRTPSHGLMLLATILNKYEKDVKMYSENISYIDWDDILDADIVFISAFTYQAIRAYALADKIKSSSKAIVVLGGLHPSAIPNEAIEHCDYVMVGEGDESIIDIYQAIKNNKKIDFAGVVYKDETNTIVNTGRREHPKNLDTVLDPNILYGFNKVTKYNTIWPQVHASRGCPHNCDYCSLINLYGNKVRTRSIESVLEDIKRQHNFYKQNSKKRFVDMMWLTDDNLFANRAYAIQLLQAIIKENLSLSFTVQVRYEVGFDNEMLTLLKQANFKEVAMGIEFIDDESFVLQNKKSTRDEIIASIQNIQSHGIRVRGLFIIGSDAHQAGCGKQLAEFVRDNNIEGVLIQGMYFVPNTTAYKNTEDRLLHKDYSKYNGNIVHQTKQIAPYQMQQEIIHASRLIYSKKIYIQNILKTIIRKKSLESFFLFAGEYYWHANTRKRLKKELVYLKNI